MLWLEGDPDSSRQMMVLQGRLIVINDSPWVACADLSSHNTASTLRLPVERQQSACWSVRLSEDRAFLEAVACSQTVDTAHTG